MNPPNLEPRQSNKARLLARLRELSDPEGDYYADPEMCHIEADKALIEYIGDPDIKAAYDAVGKWYA